MCFIKLFSLRVKTKYGGSPKPKQKKYILKPPTKPPRDFTLTEDEEDCSREDRCNPEEKEKEVETSFNSSEGKYSCHAV